MNCAGTISDKDMLTRISIIFADDISTLSSILTILNDQDQQYGKPDSPLRNLFISAISSGMTDEQIKSVAIPQISFAKNGIKEATTDQKIIGRVTRCYDKNPGIILILMPILDRETELYGKDNSPLWRKYRMLIESTSITDEQIRLFTEDQIDDAIASNKEVLEKIMKRNSETFARIQAQQNSVSNLSENQLDKFAAAGEICFGAWISIPDHIKSNIINYLWEIQNLSIIKNGALLKSIQKNPKLGGGIVCAVLLTSQIGISVYRWWITGKISGKRCFKDCSQAALTAAASVGGGWLGTFLIVSCMTNPCTFAIGAGALTLGSVAAIATSFASDKLLRKCLDLPKDQALEKAYNYVGISPSASDDEVKARIACKLQQVRPRGNDEVTEEFCKLQAYSSMVLIKRGYDPTKLAIMG